MTFPEDKVVLVRASLNIEVDLAGNPIEFSRYTKALPFIQKLVQISTKVIIVGHLGRPKNQQPHLSFQNNILKLLENDLEQPVSFVKTLQEISSAKNNVILVENIRFFEGEESEDEGSQINFAKKLASYADIFINDAFPAYRIASSTYHISKYIPSYLGPTFKEEITALDFFKQNPRKPFVAVLGGAKLSEKLDILHTLAELADTLLIGGAMAYTLMKSQGIEVGTSLIQEDKLDESQEIMKLFASKIVLPIDHILTDDLQTLKKVQYLPHPSITNENAPFTTAIDIGKKTIQKYQDIIQNAGSILWNGPMGIYESENGENGTNVIGKAIADSPAKSIVGGGDTLAALKKFGLEGYDFVSYGGGAMLAYLTQDTFPTLDIIQYK